MSVSTVAYPNTIKKFMMSYSFWGSSIVRVNFDFQPRSRKKSVVVIFRKSRVPTYLVVSRGRDMAPSIIAENTYSPEHMIVSTFLVHPPKP